MKTINFSKSFLAIGKTQESTETQEFKRYIGYSNCHILAVNPTKEELEKIYGRDIEKEPVYVGEDAQGKYVYVHFIVKTDPKDNNGEDINKVPGHGIETIGRLMVTLRPTPALNQDGDQVTVIDNYGNYGRMLKADADQHKKPVSVNGKDLRVDTDYKIAFVGQDILTHILKTYLGMGCGFDFKNGIWVKKENGKAEDDKFIFEDVKKLLAGDVTEIKDAIKIQPNNKIKLLWGIRTAEDGKQYQQVCSRDKFILRYNANSTTIAKMDKDLQDAYQRGSFSNVEYKVEFLHEWDVKPTNLDKPADTTGDMPFDAPSADNGVMPWN